MTEPSKSGEYVVFNDPPTSSNPTASGSPIMTDRVTLEQVRDWHRTRELSFARQQSPQLSGEHKQMADAIDANIAAMGEPVAVMYQHDETGRTTCVDLQQVEWGWEKNNPGWTRVQNLFTDQPASGDWDAVQEVISKMRSGLQLPGENCSTTYVREWVDRLTAALPENANV